MDYRPRITYGTALGRYGFGAGHPFGLDRLEAFWQMLLECGLNQNIDIATPVSCSASELGRFHDTDYLEHLRTLSQQGTSYLDSGDTPAFKGVYEAACTVAGSVLDAGRALMRGEHMRAFVPIAGLHHARRDGAAGFCAINDIGVLIESLRIEFGIQRIAYIDIDAHHGDGVFYAYESDPDIIFIDFHQDGRTLYPGTGTSTESGRGAALGTKLNIPLPPGTDDAGFADKWPAAESHLKRHGCEFMILQAGADSLAGDPITNLSLSAHTHRSVSAQLCTLADQLCGGRLLALGGGGYNRTNIGKAWCAVVMAMLES